ncbi:hypothetical protein K402DRAFT_407643 [Aulographum hederae CBS 113979]|uniref:BTB domain-containing protein n=1 Tax=Aulographum hederae CBS 113979 TaxID=1176131 RepID=A0A6G1GNZ3_9PEZI|nr:hypothetical protein K402DRAFT_407643 [Aulographum hederae CBS 113979]
MLAANLENMESVLAQAFVTGEFSDLTLRLRGKEWKVHRLVLCAESTWFQDQMIRGNLDGVEPLDMSEGDELCDVLLMDVLLNYLYMPNLRLRVLYHPDWPVHKSGGYHIRLFAKLYRLAYDLGICGL